ncbi:hypothetical protein Xoosp14_87 [Xanthomonas phage Xoo-sp14]|nr:hypothetical protein Xoosp14_87 [Xanthomonas phage Xoo-sp14]
MSKGQDIRETAMGKLKLIEEQVLFVEGTLGMLDLPTPAGTTRTSKITNLLSRGTGLPSEHSEELLNLGVAMAYGRENHRDLDSIELRHNGDDTIDLHARFAPKGP